MHRLKMEDLSRAPFLPKHCKHHSQPGHDHEHRVRSQSYNINDLAITLSENIMGPIRWTACEESLKDTVARVLSEHGAKTNLKVVSTSSIFSLMKSIDELCLLGLLFPTPHINHASHPVLLEIGQAWSRVGWTQALRVEPGRRTSPGCSPNPNPSILIRLSTVGHNDDGATRLLPLGEIIQVAVHEMIHAYLLLLSCRREECDADFGVMHRDSDGGGHGLAFVALLKAVLGQIQSWAPELRDFGMTDEAIHPYEDFSVRLWKRGERMSSRGKSQHVWWLAARPM